MNECNISVESWSGGQFGLPGVLNILMEFHSSKENSVIVYNEMYASKSGLSKESLREIRISFIWKHLVAGTQYIKLFGQKYVDT